MAAEEKLIQQKKEILFNQRILNLRIKTSLYGEELRKSYKVVNDPIFVINYIGKFTEKVIVDQIAIIF